MSKLLVTCCNENGGLYILNPDLSYEKVYDCDGRGLDIYQDKIYLIDDCKKELNVFDKKFNKLKSITIDTNVHGLKIYKDLIYIVNTFHDNITIFNLDLNFVSSLDFFKLSNTNDSYHMNDLWIKENKIYLSMFNRYRGRLIEKNINDYSKFFNRIVIDNLIKPHSPFFYKDKFFICESENFSVTNK